MERCYFAVTVGCGFLMLFAGCSEPTNQTVSPAESTEEAAVETLANTNTPGAPAETEAIVASPPSDSSPQRIEFQAEDGTALVGTYWPAPATSAAAPGILLMHWNPGTRSDWNMLATLLQGGAASETGANARHYAVFAFDFRGHGESGGSQDRAGYLLDAQAALELLRGLPGVNPERITLIGASIGADAAVDACGDGCAGAISLSPGSYLGVPYVDAVEAMGSKPILCVAAAEDGPSPGLCRDGEAAAQGEYQVQIYQGSAHAMQMFDITEEEPALIDLIFQWLDAHVQVE